MWRLPKLEWKDSVWRLPLAAGAAGRLAIALLEEPAECERRLAELLRSDPALTLWVMCRAPGWRESPPRDATGPAEWLLQAILGGFFDVESDASFAAAQLARSSDGYAASSLPADEPETENWAATLLHDAIARLSGSGPPANHGLLRDCSWFPVWLQSAEIGPVVHTRDCESDLADQANPPNAVMSGLLSRVIHRVRRLHELETQFAAVLEREKIAALRELAYGASHEINNPLANIATRAQALLREESDPERKRKLATIAAQAFRAHEMIADMMLFAKPPSPEFQPTDIFAVVQAVTGEMLPEAQSQETQLQLEPSAGSLIVSADATQLGVAVKALVRNALEALVTGGTVVITVRETAPDTMGTSWLEIVVRDSGPGITPEVRRHLFDPFYSGREAGRGLGFGLAKCWRIAELHRGEVRVESEPGCGATFTLRLPMKHCQ